MMRVKSDNYMTIQGFMRTDLGLKGNELMIYAIIYGFSQSERQWYTGSRQYLADWTGCTARTVQTVLDKLTDEGLIVKRKGRKNGAVYCDYQTVFKSENISLSESEKISLKKVKKFHSQKGKNFTLKSEKISHHNIEHIKEDNNNTYLSEPVRDLSEEFGEIWETYPKRTNRKQAETEYIKARENGISFDEVLNGVRSYAQHVKSEHIKTKYVKNLANYLKAEAWTDEYGPTDQRGGYDISPDLVEELISGVTT